ncbi:MAG: hypothetical protein ACLR3U_02920 [Christensenellaceae bacterium]
MLNPQEVSNLIEEKLNEIGKTWHDPYTFKLFSEIGEDKGGADIRGILRSDSAEFAPVPGDYTEGKFIYSVDLPVPAARANYHFLQVKGIVEELIKNNQNLSHKFTNGNGILTFAEKKTGAYKNTYGTGETVTMPFSVAVTYTENAVTSADKHWLLDGVEIPYLEESVTVEREGTMRNIFTEQYNKLLLTGQTKYYNFKIPYESAVWNKLQKEILNSSVSQNVTQGTYELKYYDGSAFTEAAPFTTKVKIFRSGKSSSMRPDASAFDVTFTDYDGPDTNYWLGLLDFPFDMNGEDTRYFENKGQQSSYFEGKIADGGAPFVQIEAPNLDSLFITQQVYQGNTALNNQFNLANKNYAVIRVMENSMPIRFFYYFITKATIGAGGKMLLDLRLDTVQSFFFDPKISFSDCMIERAHLNRFQAIPEDSTKVKFTSDPNSKIFNAEEGMNFPKRLVSRNKLSLKFTGNAAVDDWLNENVAYWVYVFIDSKPKIKNEKGEEVSSNYSVYDLTPDNSTVPLSLVNEIQYLNPTPFFIHEGLKGATSCICYPVYRNASKVIITQSSLTNTIRIYIRGYGRDGFEKLNSNTSYYYTIKLSILPPFDFSDHMSIVNGNLIIETNEAGEYLSMLDYSFQAIATSINSGIKSGVLVGFNQMKKEIETEDYEIYRNLPISKAAIMGRKPPHYPYNPKLNGQNFKELVITAANGDSFTYDVQKIVEPYISFMYSEPIQPEITKYYMRLNPTGLYLTGTEENYTGLVGSTDNSLAFANDQYSAFIANNKNFYLQSNMKIATGILKSASNAVGEVFSGKAGSAAMGLLTSGVDAAVSFVDRSMTVDNMKNAPSQLKNANGNVIFNMFATDLGLYVEEYIALEGDLKTANDFMNLYGFSFDSVANVKDYVHIRKYHNYIKAQLQGITGNISNTARDDLRQRFANGIRFWNQDNISYQYENYELWLED